MKKSRACHLITPNEGYSQEQETDLLRFETKHLEIKRSGYSCVNIATAT